VCSKIKGATPKNVVHVNIHFLGPISKMNELCSFPRQTVSISVYAPTSNAKEAEVEWLYEALQDLLEFTLKKDVIFIIGDWNAKVGDQEIPGVTDKFGLRVQNEAGQRLTEFCQENTQFQSINPLELSLFNGSTLTYMTTGKTIALTR